MLNGNTITEGMSWGALARLALMACLALSASACSSCGDDPSGPDKKTDMSMACVDSTECVAEDAGKLCVAGACVACDDDAQCTGDASYGDGASCKEGICEVCAPGTPGCACDEQSACAVGECIAELCVECDRGDLECICRDNGTCKAGNQCGDENLCVACVPGVEGCPCDAGSCGDGLACQADVCVPDTCSPGATDCPCDAGGCASGSDYCSDMNICEECSSDVPGCGCDVGDVCEGNNFCDDQTVCQLCPDTQKPETCGCMDSAECSDGLVCDGDDNVCRAAVECANTDCGNFACDDSLGDAECLSDQCVAGFIFDAATSTCIMPSLATCLDAAGMLTMQGQQCDMAGKACVDTINGPACVTTCEILDCPASNTDCVLGATPTTDSACGACQPGYTLTADATDPTLMTCQLDPLANCSAGDIDSILGECNARFQLCVSDPNGSGGAECGGCKSGRVYDADLNKCVELEVCGNSVCVDGEFCFYPQNGSVPKCQAECADNEAYDEGTNSCISCNVQCNGDSIFPSTIKDAQGNAVCGCSEEVFCAYNTDGTTDRCFQTDCAAGEARTEAGTCSTCALSCGDDPGERARVWPLRDNTGECFCETQQGSYRPYGNSSKPESCDGDDDGWINRTAKSVFDDATANADAAALANFRCQRRIVDRVRLINEYGQRRNVSLCNGKLQDYEPGIFPPDCGPNGANITKVVLFEADDIDDNSRMSLKNTEYPLYGTRKLRAAEVNSMTKACVSLSADYNANGTQDLIEAQPFKKSDLPNPGLSDDEFFFRGLSHFTEIHSAYYQPPVIAGDSGVYVIEERSRCDGDFPLTYPNDKADYYWDQCTRSRRGTFDNLTTPEPGHDFADYHCDTSSSTCPLEWQECMGNPQMCDTVTVKQLFDAGTDGNDSDSLIDHDLCSLKREGKVLPNKYWLGMTHNSQFQCAQLQATTPGPAAPALPEYQLGIDNFLDSMAQASGSPQFVANTCGAIKLCSDPTDTSCNDSEPKIPATSAGLALIGQPHSPQFSCSAKLRPDLSVDQVVFGLVRYIRPEGNPLVTLAFRNGEYIRGCVDESKGVDGEGFSDFCPGYQENPRGVKTAGNSGDYGKLICSCNAGYGGVECEIGCPGQELHAGGPNYLVEDSGVPVQNNTTAEVVYACDPDDFYCLTYPPIEGLFEGGRRGYWMCGDFALTRPADPSANPVQSATTATNDVYELDGKVEKSPILRIELESAGCAAGGSCYKAF